MALIAALLHACAPVPEGGQAASGAAVDDIVESEPAAGSDDEAGDVASLPPGSPGSKMPRPKINDDPRRLLGLDSDALTELLGEPRFVRKELVAQLWRYRNEKCILDLFLYRASAADDGGGFVRHYEARSLSKAHTTARDCLGVLLGERAQSDAG